jgi:hypothetical protein
MEHVRAGLIRGRLRLEVRAGGALIARRAGSNAVLRGGAELVARRLAGLEAESITAVGLGFGTESADLGAVALTPPTDPGIPPEALRSPVAATDATVATDRPDVVALSLATLFHPTLALDGVTEAGLFAGDRLYNQVVFEPVSLKVGQDVTFFWDIDFPFGH